VVSNMPTKYVLIFVYGILFDFDGKALQDRRLATGVVQSTVINRVRRSEPVFAIADCSVDDVKVEREASQLLVLYSL